MNVLVVNRANNMGDALCQMRGLKEWKEQNPDVVLDFVTCHYLHYLMASHTDLFRTIRLVSFPAINQLAIDHPGYDRLIEFEIDWGAACDHGILKAWTEKTLGFTPSTDRPYYLMREEEAIIAKAHVEQLHKRFAKLVLMQFTTPSGAVRSFRPEDHERLFQLIPKETAILYPGPIALGLQLQKGMDHRNLIPLPGYDVGVMAALLTKVDLVVGAHGGTIMLAHAVGAKNVVQVMFGEGGTKAILQVPEWDNLYYETNRQVNWEELAAAIATRL